MGIFDTLLNLSQQLEETKQTAESKTPEVLQDVITPQIQEPTPVQQPQYFAPALSMPPKTTKTTVQKIISKVKQKAPEMAKQATQALKNITGTSPYQQLLQMFFGKSYPITQTPGRAAPSTRKYYQYHRGVDIATPSGTPIRLPFAGQLYFQGQQQGYGQRVGVLDPQTGTIYYFSHLSRIPKLTPQLSAGSIIGYTGGIPGSYGAGYTTGPHVDIEVFKK